MLCSIDKFQIYGFQIFFCLEKYDHKLQIHLFNVYIVFHVNKDEFQVHLMMKSLEVNSTFYT